MEGPTVGDQVVGDVLDAFPSYVAMLDAEGKVVAINRAWHRATHGWRLAGGGDPAWLAVGLRYVDALTADGGDPRAKLAADGIEAVLAGRRPRFELEYACEADGDARWLVLTVTSLRSGGALVAHADITARKQAEHAVMAQNGVLALVAAGARLEDVLDEIVLFLEAQLPGTRCEVRLLDGDSLRLRAAPTAPEGYRELVATIPISPGVGSCGTAAATGRLVITPDVELDPAWEQFRELAHRFGIRSAWSFPIYRTGSLADPLGTRGPRGTPPAGVAPMRRDELQGTVAVYKSVTGEPTSRALNLLSQAAHLVAIGVERARVLGELEESEERFRLLLDGIPDAAVFMVDLMGRIATWNVAAERIYGYEAGEAVGMEVIALEVAGAPRERVSDNPQREAWQRRRTGDRFFASVGTTAMRNADGTLRGHAHVVRDLTQRHQLEEQLRHAQKMEAIGRLAGGIAHDFNNILTVIRANLDSLDDPSPEGDAASRRPEYVSEIVAATDRAAGLTRQLLAFSRKQVLDSTILDLNHVVLQCEKLLRRLMGEHITFVSRLEAQTCTIFADAGQVEQILINLSLNARDAMPQGGTLCFETHQHVGPGGAEVELVVSDTGVGMDDATRARIFEPFFTTKPHGEGTGLGLAVVYGIVEQSGGRVEVDSAPGRGATFRIKFPAVEPPVRSVASSRFPPVLGGRERVLLVEDDELVRRALVRALRRHGYEVIEASGAEKALETLANGTAVDLLVTDVVMPGMSGPMLVRSMRHHRPTLRVLYVSGYADDLVTLGADDVDAFLQKPFSPETLLEKMRSMLDAPVAGGH